MTDRTDGLLEKNNDKLESVNILFQSLLFSPYIMFVTRLNGVAALQWNPSL